MARRALANRCECRDLHCPAPHVHSPCGAPAVVTLYRIDTEDWTGTNFCEPCAEDAANSGLFTTERPK